MRPTRALSLLATVSIAFMASPILAQDWKGMGRVFGKVFDSEGKPIPDVVVKLELPGRGRTEAKTDSKGKWAVLGVAGGVWNVDFQAQDYEPKGIQVRLAEASPNPEIKIQLEKPAGPPPEIMNAIQKGDEAYKAGRHAEARGQYEQALGLYQKQPNPRPEVLTNLNMQIARCYSQEKNYEEELAHLQAILDLDPGNTRIRTLMAMEALQAGMAEKSGELLTGLEVTDPDVYFNIAVAFYNQGKINEAIDYFSKAIALSPTYTDGYFYRGNAHLNQSKLAEAKADYQKFIDLAPADDARVATVKKVLEQLK